MSKQKIEIEAPLAPAGYEYTGELRRTVIDEWYAYEGEAHKSCGEAGEYLILRRVEPKKESWWQNLYAPGEMTAPMQRSRNAADDTARPIRLAVARFYYENGHPVYVALESVEQPLTPSAPPKE